NRREQRVRHLHRATFAGAALLFPVPSASEICPAANTHSAHQTLSRCQGSAHQAHPKPRRALRQRHRLTECARKSPGNYFLFPTREFRFAAVSSKSLSFPQLLLLQICSTNPEVEYPVSKGMRRISAPILFKIACSSSSRVFEV